MRYLPRIVSTKPLTLGNAADKSATQAARLPAAPKTPRAVQVRTALPFMARPLCAGSARLCTGSP